MSKFRAGRNNPLNAELNPICHLLALFRAHHILHASRVRVVETCQSIQPTARYVQNFVTVVTQVKMRPL
jgi:serine acetyltransferase